MSFRDDSLAGFLSRDIIDREIRQICERRPEILEDNTIIRKSQGRYRINGREVSISLVTRETKEEENWDSALPSKCPSSNMIEVIEEINALEPAMAADPNDLIVRDGPLTQPFMDYVFDTGLNETYAIEACHSDGDVTSVPLASDMKGGKLKVEPGDRLEAMSLAWNALETRDAELSLEADGDSEFGELPEMPLPPALPKSSEPAQPSAGVALAPENLWLAHNRDAVTEIVIDLPIVQSHFACHAISLCAPEACIVAPSIIASPSRSMGPRFASTSKPSAEGIDVEVDPGPASFHFMLPRYAPPTLPAEDVSQCKVPGEKRRHRFNEVIMPGELEASQVAAGAQDRGQPPGRKPATSLVLDEINFVV